MYKYLQVGKIVNTHGIRGEMKVIPLTDDPGRFNQPNGHIEKDGVYTKHDVQHVKHAKSHIIIKFSTSIRWTRRQSTGTAMLPWTGKRCKLPGLILSVISSDATYRIRTVII